MFLNFKLYLTYIYLGWSNYSFINNLSQRSKNYNILISNEALMYTALHLKFSSLFTQTQLCDIFAYEIPQKSLETGTLKKDFRSSKKENLFNKPVVVYNFHSLLSQNRFFLFVHSSTQFVKSNNITFNSSTESISELFFAANWLERECSELHGISFVGKKDLRNLMLQYGDNSAPFLKSNPTIGHKEFIYDSLTDTVVQRSINSSLKSSDSYLYV
jgi:NADH:ubiquinone oxidoreductase subunit C